MFELEENVNIGANIKVVGVGGGGSNAIATMIECGMSGVDFVVANTDIQALNSSKAGQKIQLGVDLTKGLGAGANPDVGRRSAIESYNLIVEQLKGSDMVFVTAGMGGGTGTGGAPIVAKIARELGALTIGVVTKPFTFEGKKRTKHAENGLAELKENVDALIVIPNQKLLSVSAEKTPILDTFKKADEVLLQAVKGISDLINIRGLINLDFADIRTVMANKGLALMGAGSAKGENRAVEAATQAISSPLLENVRIDGATGIIINVTGGSDLSLYEVNEASTLITEAASEDAEIIFGAVIDPNLIDEVRVTVIATGFAREDKMMGLPNMNSMQNFLNSSPSIMFDVPPMNAGQTAMPSQQAQNLGQSLGQSPAQQFQQHQQMMSQPFAPAFGQQPQQQTQNFQPQVPTFNPNMMPNSFGQQNAPQFSTQQPAQQSTQSQHQAPQYQATTHIPQQQQPQTHAAGAQAHPHMPQGFMPNAMMTTGHLPSINNVQESVQSFTNEAMANLVETSTAPAAAPQTFQATTDMNSEISTEISPIAATNSTSQIARDMLLAKAKAFRESQVGQSATTEKMTHPEQLTMMDEGKQIEEARKMARDILEVPAFIRKKQGLDQTQN